VADDQPTQRARLYLRHGRLARRIVWEFFLKTASRRHVECSTFRQPHGLIVARGGAGDAAVKFFARGQGYSLFLTPAEAVLALSEISMATPPQAAVVRMRLVDVNRQPQVTGLDSLAGTSNFFIGNDPAQWQHDVPNYARVKYTAVYPGIDQIYYGNQRQLEYDFVVAAHADPTRIVLAFDDVDAIRLDVEGNLVLETTHGDMTQQKPVIYQDINGKRQAVAGRYALGAGNRVGFEIDSYDRRHPLVIDPVLSYATYLGGNNNDVGHAIALDSDGNTYITGEHPDEQPGADFYVYRADPARSTCACTQRRAPSPASPPTSSTSSSTCLRRHRHPRTCWRSSTAAI
jgi:hypothetical protein